MAEIKRIEDNEKLMDDFEATAPSSVEKPRSSIVGTQQEAESGAEEKREEGGFAAVSGNMDVGEGEVPMRNTFGFLGGNSNADPAPPYNFFSCTVGKKNSRAMYHLADSDDVSFLIAKFVYTLSSHPHIGGSGGGGNSSGSGTEK